VQQHRLCKSKDAVLLRTLSALFSRRSTKSRLLFYSESSPNLSQAPFGSNFYDKRAALRRNWWREYEALLSVTRACTSGSTAACKVGIRAAWGGVLKAAVLRHSAPAGP
jgi:hypothetical protein